MTVPHYAALRHRAVLAVSGDERKPFLQGLLSCDMERVSDCGDGCGHGAWGALCLPQGKFLFDVFGSERDGVVYLESDRERIDELRTRLQRYRLRAKVVLEVKSDWAVAVAFGGGGPPLDVITGVRPFGEVIALRDPRLAHGGVRLYGPQDALQATLRTLALTPGDWDAWRVPLALPEGDRDIEVGKGFLLEYGFEELHGVDFGKGCYVGQETTARMKWRHLTKRRLVPFACPLAVPNWRGADIRDSDGIVVGVVRTAVQGRFLGFVRVRALKGHVYVAEEPAVPEAPPWMKDALQGL